MKSQILRERMYSNLGLELCGAAIEIDGQRLEPDESKAYIEMGISNAYPSVSAYGTTLHPQTVANSFRSMQHQVLNWQHMMRANDRSKERDEIRRDYILGSIVGVELATSQAGVQPATFKLGMPVHIRAAGVIHKNAEKVPGLLGEHLGGRHKWTVSMEINYDIIESGFLVFRADQATKAQAALMAQTTTEEFQKLNLGYVPATEASEELLDTFNFEKREMRLAIEDGETPAPPSGRWGKLPVVLVKGGLNGRVHYQGVGLVRYGAEKEAMIAQLLAHDPARLEAALDEGQDGIAALTAYFKSVGQGVGAL